MLPNASKNETLNFIKSGNHNLPADQTANLYEKVRSGTQAGSFNLKIANSNGDARYEDQIQKLSSIPVGRISKRVIGEQEYLKIAKEIELHHQLTQSID